MEIPFITKWNTLNMLSTFRWMPDKLFLLWLWRLGLNSSWEILSSLTCIIQWPTSGRSPLHFSQSSLKNFCTKSVIHGFTYSHVRTRSQIQRGGLSRVQRGCKKSESCGWFAPNHQMETCLICFYLSFLLHFESLMKLQMTAGWKHIEWFRLRRWICSPF